MSTSPTGVWPLSQIICDDASQWRVDAGNRLHCWMIDLDLNSSLKAEGLVSPHLLRLTGLRKSGRYARKMPGDWENWRELSESR